MGTFTALHVQCVPYSLVYAARGGLAGKCAKVVGGVLHEGGGSTIYSFILERGWLKRNSVKRYGGWLTRGGGLHELVRYVANLRLDLKQRRAFRKLTTFTIIQRYNLSFNLLRGRS